jgi:hypothetical protein
LLHCRQHKLEKITQQQQHCCNAATLLPPSVHLQNNITKTAVMLCPQNHHNTVALLPQYHYHKYTVAMLLPTATPSPKQQHHQNTTAPTSLHNAAMP